MRELLLLLLVGLTSCGSSPTDGDRAVDQHVQAYWDALSGPVQGQRDAARALVDLGEERDDNLLRARGLARLAYAEIHSGWWQHDWQSNLEESMALVEGTSSLAEAEALLLRGHIRGKWQHQTELGLQDLTRAMCLAEQLQVDELLARGACFAAQLYLLLDRTPKAVDLAHRALAIADHVGRRTPQVLALRTAMHTMAVAGLPGPEVSALVQRLDDLGGLTSAERLFARRFEPDGPQQRLALAKERLEELETAPATADTLKEQQRLHMLFAYALTSPDDSLEAIAHTKKAIRICKNILDRTTTEALELRLTDLQARRGRDVTAKIDAISEHERQKTTSSNASRARSIAAVYTRLGKERQAADWTSIAARAELATETQKVMQARALAQQNWEATLHGRALQAQLLDERVASANLQSLGLVLAILGIGAWLAWRFRSNQFALRNLEREMSIRESLQTQLAHSQRLDAVGAFASGVAHDVNNSLTAILGNADLAESAAKTGDVTSAVTHLQNVVDAANLAGTTTRGILNYAARGLSTTESVDLNRVVFEAHALIDRVLPTTIKLDVDIPSRAPRYAIGDAAKLKQVVMNAVLNARDALPKDRTGRGRGRIEIQLEHPPGAEGTSTLSIRDNGEGMPADVVNRAFEPFYTTKEEGAGTGLGLSVVQSIVEQQHGGSISIDSTPGAGTTLRIELQSCATPPDGVSAPRSTRTSTNRTLDGNDRTVLLGEVDHATRGTIRSQLEASGFQVLECASLDRMLDLHRERAASVDLIIIDADLPNESRPTAGGMDCVYELRTKTAAADIPILLISGLLFEESPRATTTLLKPFRAPDLLGAVERALTAQPGA